MNARKIALATLSGGLGLTGLFVVMPEAAATLPCGTWQPQKGTNSTGTNESDGLVNINNVGNQQGNDSVASNLLCQADVLSGNRIYLFQDAPAAPADNNSRCETLQQTYAGSSNSTGSNTTDAPVNVNNVANSQGQRSIASNVACGADIASGNTIVLFGDAAPSAASGGQAPERCLTTQTQYGGSKNQTGNNTVTDPGLANVNNVLNTQGNQSVLSNVLCDASVLSGNTLAIGGSDSGMSMAMGGTSGGGTAPKSCQTTQTQQGTNTTGSNSVFALLGVNNLLNLQGNQSVLSNVGCQASILSGNVVETGPITLSDIFVQVQASLTGMF